MLTIQLWGRLSRAQREAANAEEEEDFDDGAGPTVSAMEAELRHFQVASDSDSPFNTTSPLMALVVFTLGPIVASFYLSLTHYEVVRAPVWAGLAAGRVAGAVTRKDWVFPSYR